MCAAFTGHGTRRTFLFGVQNGFKLMESGLEVKARARNFPRKTYLLCPAHFFVSVSQAKYIFLSVFQSHTYISYTNLALPKGIAAACIQKAGIARCWAMTPDTLY